MSTHDTRAAVDSDDSLGAAIAYCTLGWVPVPNEPRSKHPRLISWQTATMPDAEQLLRWWGDPDNQDGICIVCGRTLVVIDVDRHGPIDGEDALADLEASYGKLPDCPVVLTGGGGRHLYFRAPEGVTITNDAGRRLGPGLDVRADGGQVVAPPSLHASGQRYQWEASSLPSTFGPFETRSNYVDLPDLPDWLVTLLTSEPTTPTPHAERPPRGSNGKLPGEQWAAVTYWGDMLAADGATFLGLRTDHRTGHPYELWARPGADHTSATIGYGGSDVLKVFTSNWPGLDEGATYTKFGYLAAAHYGGDFQAARAALEADGYTFDHDVDLASLVASATEARPTEVKSMSWLHTQEFDPLRFAVPNIIPEGLTLLVGPPKAGKSWLVLGWLLSTASRQPVLGAETVARRPVLYLALEDSDRRLQSRMRMLTLPGQDWPRSFEYVTDVAPDNLIDLVVSWLDRHAGAAPFVVLDTLGKVLPPSKPGESSYQRDYRVSGALKALVDCYPGAALVINHHDRKAGAEDFVDSVSGTHGLAGAADTVVVLARKRHHTDALLQVTGRDVDEAAYLIDFTRGIWTLRGGSVESAAAAADTQRFDLGSRALSVLSHLEDNPDGMRYRDIEAMVGFQPGKELQRLIDSGHARKASRGLYVVAGEAPDLPILPAADNLLSPRNLPKSPPSATPPPPRPDDTSDATEPDSTPHPPEGGDFGRKPSGSDDTKGDGA